jgi:hypothetical protein
MATARTASGRRLPRFRPGVETSTTKGLGLGRVPGPSLAVMEGAAAVKSQISFSYPHQVVADPALTVNEKRAILSAWASDAHAIESLPTLRQLPGTPFPVTFSAIMDARQQLDRLILAEDTEQDRRMRHVTTAMEIRASRSTHGSGLGA